MVVDNYIKDDIDTKYGEVIEGVTVDSSLGVNFELLAGTYSINLTLPKNDKIIEKEVEVIEQDSVVSQVLVDYKISLKYSPTMVNRNAGFLHSLLKKKTEE